MAALGCSTATTQIGQLCAAKYDIRVAGFQAITPQSCSVGSRAAMAGEGRHRAYQYYSAWSRGNNSRISGRMPSFGSQSRGWWGNFLQIFRPSANAFNFGNSFGEDVSVDNRPTELERLESKVEPAEAENKAVKTAEVVEVKKAAQNANVAEKALDKVGDVLRTTGLEINLDVGLKELTIKELVLRDLGLVLEVKTKPLPPTQAAKKDEGGNNTA